MEQQYDLIVVGGGLAGSALATSMAAGARTLVIEKEPTFRDRVRGEWLAPWGMKELRALDLEDALAEAGAHELPALAGRTLKPRPSRSPEGDIAVTFYHPELQEVLLQRARNAGADVVRGARVTGVYMSGDRGRVDFVSAEGSFVVTAPLVVGAEGRTSLVRRAMGLPQEVHRSARVLAGARLGGIHIDESSGYFVIAEDARGLVSLFPQGGGYARAYVFEEGADASAYTGRDGLARFIEALVRMGVPADAVSTAEAAGPLAAFVTDDAWVPGAALGPFTLIGDAAGASDPTWGMGMALAFRDARVLAEALRSHDDPQAAAARYAAERDEYFRAIITVEHWMTDIQLVPGAEAAERRAHIMSAWKADPDRALDLPGRGPDHDVSEAMRIRVFAEDVPMEVAPAVVAQPAVDSPDAVAQRFVDSLSARDFGALEAVLGPSMRMRALLPGGPREIHGATEVREAFRGWYADAEDFAVLSTGAGRVADRLTLHWRFQLRWRGESQPRVIEQQAYAKVADGRIVVLDMVCSGFRPLEAAA